jgi:hypothetical protein
MAKAGSAMLITTALSPAAHRDKKLRTDHPVLATDLGRSSGCSTNSNSSLVSSIPSLKAVSAPSDRITHVSHKKGICWLALARMIADSRRNCPQQSAAFLLDTRNRCGKGMFTGRGRSAGAALLSKGASRRDSDLSRVRVCTAFSRLQDVMHLLVGR